MNKYEVSEDIHVNTLTPLNIGVLDNQERIICICVGPERITLAHKICSILNETSRAQGKIYQYIQIHLKCIINQLYKLFTK